MVTLSGGSTRVIDDNDNDDDEDDDDDEWLPSVPLDLAKSFSLTPATWVG